MFRKNLFLKATLLTFLLPLGAWGITSGPFLIFGKRVEGTVVTIKYHAGSRLQKSSYQPYWSRVIDYPTENSQILQLNTLDNSLFVGERVGVYYLPGTTMARLATFNELWWLVVYAICLQVVFVIVIGILAMYFSSNARLKLIAFPLGFSLLCWFIGALSAYPGYRQSKILSQGIQTTGVISLEPVIAPKEKHYPVVQFITRDGYIYKAESPSYNKGAKVKVFYLPKQPKEALVFTSINALTNEEIASIQQWWVWPLSVMILPSLVVTSLMTLMACLDRAFRT